MQEFPKENMVVEFPTENQLRNPENGEENPANGTGNQEISQEIPKAPIFPRETPEENTIPSILTNQLNAKEGQNPGVPPSEQDSSLVFPRGNN